MQEAVASPGSLLSPAAQRTSLKASRLRAKESVIGGSPSDQALRTLERSWQAPGNLLQQLDGAWTVRLLADRTELSDPSRAIVGLYSSEFGRALGMDLASRPQVNISTTGGSATAHSLVHLRWGAVEDRIDLWADLRLVGGGRLRHTPRRLVSAAAGELGPPFVPRVRDLRVTYLDEDMLILRGPDGGADVLERWSPRTSERKRPAVRRLGNVGGASDVNGRSRPQPSERERLRLGRLESAVGRLEARSTGIRAEDVLRAQEIGTMRNDLASFRHRLEGMERSAGTGLEKLGGSVRSLEDRLTSMVSQFDVFQEHLAGRLRSLESAAGNNSDLAAILATLEDARDNLSSRLDALEGSTEVTLAGGQLAAVLAALEDVRGNLSSRLDHLESSTEVALSGRRYVVDRVALGALGDGTVGLSFRHSKSLDDRDSSDCATWGTIVEGVDDGDGWVRVGNRFLPKKINGAVVLTSQEDNLLLELEKLVGALTERVDALERADDTGATSLQQVGANTTTTLDDLLELAERMQDSLRDRLSNVESSGQEQVELSKGLAVRMDAVERASRSRKDRVIIERLEELDNRLSARLDALEDLRLADTLGGVATRVDSLESAGWETASRLEKLAELVDAAARAEAQGGIRLDELTTNLSARLQALEGLDRAHGTSPLIEVLDSLAVRLYSLESSFGAGDQQMQELRDSFLSRLESMTARLALLEKSEKSELLHESLSARLDFLENTTEELRETYQAALEHSTLDDEARARRDVGNREYLEELRDSLHRSLRELASADLAGARQLDELRNNFSARLDNMEIWDLQGSRQLNRLFQGLTDRLHALEGSEHAGRMQMLEQDMAQLRDRLTAKLDDLGGSDFSARLEHLVDLHNSRAAEFSERMRAIEQEVHAGRDDLRRATDARWQGRDRPGESLAAVLKRLHALEEEAGRWAAVSSPDKDAQDSGGIAVAPGADSVGKTLSGRLGRWLRR